MLKAGPAQHLGELLLVLVALTAGCSAGGDQSLPAEVATQGRAAVSPSGKYVLTVSVGKDERVAAQSFEILDRNSAVLFTSQDKFRTRDTTFFLWDVADRVWVYSGDVGTFFWESKGAPNQWEKSEYHQGGVPAPPFLKKVRPESHPW